MTEAYREQYPLLHDDYSEEEHYSPNRRFRPMALRTRVRNKVKGAASIFKRWPGYWSTAVIYWWIGVGMFIITTLLIYNGIIVFALLPSEYIETPFIQRLKNNNVNPSERTSILPDILMHVLVNLGEEVDLNKYLPYINILKNQYSDYSYHLLIVVNDTMVDSSKTKEMNNNENNNEIALNLLLHNSHTREKKDLNGVSIEQISLTKFMDKSPLKKYWRNIPNQFIDFLIRAISIWDKGGIAFNPIIITPYSPHAIYIEKIKSMLMRYMTNSDYENDTNYNKKKSDVLDTPKVKQKVNNIRDIINAMELSDDNHDNTIRENEELTSLEPAESRFLSPVILSFLNDTKMVIDKISGSFRPNRDNKKNNDTENRFSEHWKNDTHKTYHQNNDNSQLNSTLDVSQKPKLSFMPFILKYLLNKNPGDDEVKENKTQNISLPIVTRKRKSIIHAKNNNKDNNNIDDEIVNDTYNQFKPMIIPANISNNYISKAGNSKANSFINIDNDRFSDQLTIDLKGNILGTTTPCHAFIGTLFSNVIHYKGDESITDLIIHELSLFCKGLLSSCSGIDVMLL